MNTHSVTVLDERAKALERALAFALDCGDGPVAAIDLAEACGFHSGNRESLRRLVRVVVTYAREQCGMRICANAHGVWLARSGDEWRDYLASIGAKTKFKFVRLARVKRAVGEAISGQRGLFEQAVEGSREAEWAEV